MDMFVKDMCKKMIMVVIKINPSWAPAGQTLLHTFTPNKISVLPLSLTRIVSVVHNTLACSMSLLQLFGRLHTLILPSME
jgi:hypothetical protein